MSRVAWIGMAVATVLLTAAPAGADCLGGQLHNGDFWSWSRGIRFQTPWDKPGQWQLLADGWAGGSGVNGYWIVTREAVTLYDPGLPTWVRSFIRMEWLRMGDTNGDRTFLEHGEHAGELRCVGGVRRWAGQTVTLSYWSRAFIVDGLVVTPIMWQSFGTGGGESPFPGVLLGQPMALTTQWQQGWATITLPSVAGKTIGAQQNDYLGVGFNINASMGMVDIADVRIERVE